MSEILGNNFETQQNIAQKDSSNEISRFENYYKNNPKAEELKQKQTKEAQQLQDDLEAPVLEETRNELDKQALINEAKTIIYENIGINENLETNSSIKKFLKGLVDGMILENYDLAIEVYNTNGKILLDAIKQILSWEGLKQVAKALGESVGELFSGDAYEKGKSIAELGLVATGLGVGFAVGRKSFKVGMKQILKRSRRKGETFVDAPAVKQIANQVEKRVDEIVPKQTLNPEEMLRKNTPNRERVPDLDSLYSNPNYKFLGKHRDILGEDLKLSDIVGEGDNAVIMRHPTNDKVVVKIAKEGKVDKIDLEFSNHNTFYSTLRQGKLDFPGKLSEDVVIPRVWRMEGTDKGYFIMKKVDGQSLKTRFYIDYYKKEFEKLGFKKDYLEGLTDGEITQLMDKNKLYQINPNLPDVVYENKAMINSLGSYFDNFTFKTPLGKEFNNTVGFLDWKGAKHTDLHPGNVMLGKDGKVYIIDFGRAEIKK